MSTYTGDATIVDIISASASATNQVSVNAYTVPVGKFAEVQLVNCSGNCTNGGTINGGRIGGVAIVNDTLDDATSISKSFEDFQGAIWLNEGETVDALAQSGTGSISVTIKEYNKP
jgi:hypothetical protein